MSKSSANALQAVLDRASRDEEPEAARPIAPTPVRRSKGREGTVLIGGHFPPEVQRQLKIIAAEEGTTSQALLAEALDMLFQHRGKRLTPPST